MRQSVAVQVSIAPGLPGRNFFDAALLGDDIHACHCLFPRVELKVHAPYL